MAKVGRVLKIGFDFLHLLEEGICYDLLSWSYPFQKSGPKNLRHRANHVFKKWCAGERTTEPAIQYGQ